MTYSDTEPRGTLRYRLLASSLRPSDSPLADPGNWGHEYVRHLAAELGEEFEYREEHEDDEPEDASTTDPANKTPPKLSGTIEDLRQLTKQCSRFLLQHNAEPDAVDLLQELEMIGEIVELVDNNTYERVSQYMSRFV